MTYYTELSTYVYLPETVPDGVTALNVGWLEPGEAFATGGVPDEFVQALGVLV
ncbi:hypothetical protein OG800_07935 [Streptomyces sp. NBC_00445]|uniref:DUF7919 family protein n=1 Tax=Streptomyces sp. NBC_00445 TaxID=2975745 RepID=UPI002E20F1D8